MKFGPRRGHVMAIFERFFRDFGLLLAALVLCLFLGDFQLLLENGNLVVLVLIAPVLRLIQYLTTRYSIDGERLIIESGLFQKKRRELPLANITTVDFTQSLIFQMAGVYAVHVDTNSCIGSGDSGQVKMVLNGKDAIFVKKLLLARQQDLREDRISEEISGNTVMASPGELVLMGLSRSQILIAVQMIAYGSAAVGILDKIFTRAHIDGDQVLQASLMKLSVPLLVFILLTALYLISVIVSVLLTMVKYYGFRVTDREESLFIEYGLLTRRTYTLMKEKISGISYNQPFVMRLLRRGTVEVFAAGYGGSDENDEKEIALLYPILRREKLPDFLERFLPEFQDTQEPVKARPRAFLWFFLCPRFFFAAVFFFAMWLVPVPYPAVTAGLKGLGTLVLLAAAGSVVLEFKNTALAAGEKSFLLIGGGYTKKMVLLKTDKVETIEETASLRKRRKRRLTDIGVGILAPKEVANHKVRNLGLEVFENAREKLVY